jgi:protein arginine kinase
MKLDDLLSQTSEWLKGTGPNSDIVISSRIRLARNLEKYPFSHWSTRKQSEEILSIVEPVVKENPHMKNGIFVRLNEISALDRQFLVERHLISREHAEESDHRAVTIDSAEVVSLMINEEDHLRLQVIQSGFNLPVGWKLIDLIDTQLESKLSYAFSVEWGYLTSCPTNIGTGMRASVMLHLPALVSTKQISKVLHAISKLNLTARGLFGEGTEASGNFFQISNQVTLGHTEEDIIDNLQRIVRQIIEYEQNARTTLLGKGRETLEDQIWRAYGTLKSARIITSSETIDLLSAIRLGVDIETIKDIDRSVVNELFILTQSAHLQKIEGKMLSAPQRDIKRANLVRIRLK